MQARVMTEKVKGNHMPTSNIYVLSLQIMKINELFNLSQCSINITQKSVNQAFYTKVKTTLYLVVNYIFLVHRHHCLVYCFIGPFWSLAYTWLKDAMVGITSRLII